MKWTNGELVEIYANAYDNIQLAIDELNGVDEYKEILETLKQAKHELEETDQFLLENMGENSRYVYMHQHIEK